MRKFRASSNNTSQVGVHKHLREIEKNSRIGVDAAESDLVISPLTRRNWRRREICFPPPHFNVASHSDCAA